MTPEPASPSERPPRARKTLSPEDREAIRLRYARGDPVPQIDSDIGLNPALAMQPTQRTHQTHQQSVCFNGATASPPWKRPRRAPNAPRRNKCNNVRQPKHC